jgi:hypothetical protein
MTPCIDCAKKVAKFGCKRVISLDKYEGESARGVETVFKNAGIDHSYLEDKVASLYTKTDMFEGLHNVVDDLVNSEYDSNDITIELSSLMYKQIGDFFEFDKEPLKNISVPRFIIPDDMLKDKGYLMKIYIQNFYKTLYDLI